jgi:predicted DNA-binding transcriptional regulator AlpA
MTQQEHPLPALMTSKEVSALLRVHPATLSKWRERGHGPKFVMISAHSPRYVRAEVEALLNGEVKAA